MSEFFDKDLDDNNLIPPDYSPSEDDDDDIDESIIPDEEDRILVKELENERLERENKVEEKPKEEKKMSSPFGNPQSITSPWLNTGGGTSWGQQNNGSPFGSQQVSTPPWMSNNNGGGIWGQQQGNQYGGSGNSFFGSNNYSSPSWAQQNNNQKVKFSDINKSIMFIPFLDGIVSPYGATGPGIAPRDIYDMCPRFDVWKKITAFNPQRIFVISPLNILTSANGATNVGEVVLTYFSYCVSAWLRKGIDICQIIVASMIGQPTELVIEEVLSNKYSKISKNDCIYIGVYSGYGTSDSDLRAAEKCGISYMDINQFLNGTI